MYASWALAKRIEDGEVAAGIAAVHSSARLWPARNAAHLSVAGAAACYCGTNSPLSQVLGLGMAGPVTAADMDHIEDFYRSYQSPVNLIVCPHADATVLDALAERRYRLFEFTNALVTALSTPPETAGAWVRRAEPHEAQAWAQAMARGFFGRDDTSAPELEVGLALFHATGACNYFALIGGEIAGGGAMLIHHGVAHCYADSTLIRFRGKGVQTALIRARMAYAALQGCDLAIAYTMPGSVSQRNYERCGFQVAYTRAGLTKDLD
jgi:hypothetical protein